MNKSPLDQAERERAVTTFHRNIIVTAGAGTGKTSLLISRLIHLMLRKPNPIKITEIVALTFTNKTANEMKSRLRETLETLSNAKAGTEPLDELVNRYDLSLSEITHLTRAAIRQLEHSEIGTIHHFATTLLRLYPLEAGVDPQFRIDEGGRASERIFEETWTAWLEEELTLDAPRHLQWKTVLARISLAEMREAAMAISSETIEVGRLLDQLKRSAFDNPIRTWLQSLESAAEVLLGNHPESRNVEKLVSAALTIFKKLLENGSTRVEDLLGLLDEADQVLIRSTKKAGKVKGWTDDEIKEANRLIRIARQVLQVDRAMMHKLLDLLSPVIKRVKREMYRRGLISFDDLLIRARNLLRDHPLVRKELKGRYRAILIDEFQDTDPAQYEVLLFLSELEEEAASVWQKVNLSPGKLFVVGDPKQSIYGFRRADIAACQTVRALILDQNGIECLLTTNFRSHAGILKPVNRLFEKLIQKESGQQPEYIAIQPADQGRGEDKNSFQKLVLRRVKNANEDEKGDAELARQLEGEAIAKWLSETVIGKAMIRDRSGEHRPVQKADVAILMRSLPSVHFYLEALRRWGIAYTVEGEKRFYQTQEVIDAINLLRVVADPYDRLALVGLLRSPLGGLTDAEIYGFHQKGQLSYLSGANTDNSLSPHMTSLYCLLERLHDEVVHLPVGKAVDHIFQETPITLLSAASIRGAQALANLEKIRQTAERLGSERTMTFKEVVANLARSVTEGGEEPESPLSEEGLNAVKVFSVHKAKGLEFPVVVLAGCHAATGVQRHQHIGIRQDWSSGLSGFFVGDFCDLNSIYLGEKEKLREIAEEKRVLYVAMTRAREHLMLTAAATGKRSAGSFLSFFEAGFEAEIEAASGDLLAGIGGIAVQEVAINLDSMSPGPVPKKTVSQVDWQSCDDLWKKRREQYEAILKRPVFVTPTFLKQTTKAPENRTQFSSGGKTQHDGAKSLLIGCLAHHFLETWDFSRPPASYRDELSTFISRQKRMLAGFSQVEIFKELETIFKVFFHSSPYEEICRSKILGREIPFLLPWGNQVMEGVIDLVYENSGRLYIGEYKTDRVQKADLSSAAARYRHQTTVYPEAVRQALQRDVTGVQLIFLRLGEAVMI